MIAGIGCRAVQGCNDPRGSRGEERAEFEVGERAPTLAWGGYEYECGEPRHSLRVCLFVRVRVSTLRHDRTLLLSALHRCLVRRTQEESNKRFV